MMKKFNKKPLFLRKEKWYKKGGKSLKKNTWTAKKKRFKFKLRLKWIHFFCWLYKKVISSLEINFSLFLFSNRKKTLTPSHWSKVRKWNFRNVISEDNDVIMFAFAYKQESEIITMKWKKKKLFVFAFSDRRTDNFATNIWNFLLLLLPTLFSGGGNKIVTKQIMGRVNVITRIGFLHFYHPFTPKDIHSF
jgi:hypothetical protein